MGERNKRVFELMREHNLRKVDMAECLGISKSAVTQWEKRTPIQLMNNALNYPNGYVNKGIIDYYIRV